MYTVRKTQKRHQANSFGVARENSLALWLNRTARELASIDNRPFSPVTVDLFANSFECRWQGLASKITNKNNWHVPHFCSLGEWASGVTDLLLQEHLDPLSFKVGVNLSEDSKQINHLLWRHYTRILLLVEQISGDLVSLRREVTGENSNSIKKTLSKTITQDQLFGFINNICKHKDNRNGFHSHNQHLPLFFLDSNQSCHFNKPYSISKLTYSETESPLAIFN